MSEKLSSQPSPEDINLQIDQAWEGHRPNSAQTILDAHSVDTEIIPGNNRISREEATQNRRLKEAWGDDFGQKFKERDDWAKYLDSRPESADNSNQESVDEVDTYEKSSISQLARLLGEAEYNDDKTSMGNISDVLIGKMDKVAEGLSDKAEGASTNFKHDDEVNPRQAFYDRVMSIKDAKIAELKAKEEANKAQNTNTQKTNEEVKDFGPAGIIVGSEDDMPKVIKTNQTPNNDIQDLGEAGVMKDEGFDDYEDDQPTAELPKQDYLPVLYEGPKDNLPVLYEPPTTQKGLFSRIRNKVKEALAKDPAVRFDGKDYTGQKVPGKKIGDAIVDTRDREYQTRHYVAAAALGVGAVAISLLATKGIHSPILSDVNYTGGGFPKPPTHEVPVPSKLGTIKHAETAKDVVTGALDRFGVKGYNVEGDTSSNVAELVKSLKKSGSIDLIVGRNADGTGHVVSAARDLADGMTGNAFASQEVALNPADLKDFMEEAAKAGIKITEK